MLRSVDSVVCFAHLRWDFVYQRPQHVMTRLASRYHVLYFEEPRFDARASWLELRECSGVTIATPHLPSGMSRQARAAEQRRLLDAALAKDHRFLEPILWYYTPLSLEFSDHLDGVRVYDCMDELALFRGAAPDLPQRERQLLAECSLVFTGGRSLYYAKRRLHRNVHCFPSAVESAHFAPAGRPRPDDMHGRRPCAGFYGVIDERLDIRFVDELSLALPEWDLYFVGPVVKIDEAILPSRDNITYTGMRSYEELPAYLEHWDVALLPFALNEATRFISPTKTLEYLAAGKPIVSSAIADVVDPYGTLGLVRIARDGRHAAALCRAAVAHAQQPERREVIASLLERHSWDATVAAMDDLLRAAIADSLEAAG